MILQSNSSLAIVRAALADAGPGSSDILIGVVDGMPDLDHPSLRAASLEILEHMVPPDAAGVDAHGTGTCSLIFGSGEPVTGLAPACKGLILPLFFRNGRENAIRPVSQLDLARAISFALERGVSIINVSAGQKSVTTEAEGHLEQALERCIERRVLVTAAAGNDGCACINLPAGVDAASALAMLHRVGASRSSFTAIHAEQVAQLGRGTSAMSISGANEVNVAEPSALTQAGCSCETKPEDETAAALKPHGILRAPDQSTSPVRQNSAMETGLTQQACSCGGGQPPQLVFTLGALWFDFGTEARYDAIVQQLGDPVRANNPAELFAFLRQNLHFASGLTFILMQDQIPLYAIQPAGPFALQIYSAMLDALESSLDDTHNKEQRVSIPGMIAGSTRLLNGMTVPVVFPDLRGMYKWQSRELIAAAKAAVGKDVASDDDIFNFLNRVYYELRNLGVAPQDRALNFAATNAYQTNIAFAESAGRNLALDSITVAKSPICRPDSDCWDVQLLMFDPENERRASRVYRYTVDVSDVLPVTVGTVRSWAVRTGTL